MAGIRMNVKGDKFVVICDSCKKEVKSVIPFGHNYKVCERCHTEKHLAPSTLGEESDDKSKKAQR